MEDERFTRFLQDITIGVFNQLASNSKQKRLNVNTIILSGRSCRLEPLQQALSEALDELKWNAKIVKFDSKSNEEKPLLLMAQWPKHPFLALSLRLLTFDHVDSTPLMV